MTSSRWILGTAGALLVLATVLGALGAHALATRFDAQRLAVYDTAVRYHFYHALGLLGIGLAARYLDGALLRAAAWLVLAGVLLFSGSLYALCFGAPRPLGIVTPVGGVALIAGWSLFAIAAWRG
ncbi:MAG TPA: DUF423 domain-containing protein [Steroidobacteraceae bacterium]|nr:DUF423 domain-containing protein [Steroidobacteraceae bacterium]